MKNIYTMLDKHRWHLHIWDDRYSKGVWAMLAPAAYICIEIYETTESDDSWDETTFAHFIMNEGSWMPIVLGDGDLNQVLSLLDEKIENLLCIKDFEYKVYDTYNEWLV